MRKPLFTGVCTALVTPFLDQKVNYPMLQQLLRRQLDAGIEAVVIAGTTGEGATLTDDEKIEMVRCAKAYAGERARIIAGTGSNSTEHTVRLSREAQESGADALLIVSPYYNKASDEGLYAHFAAAAHAVRIPVIVYNVPSRTGVDIPVSVYRRLARIPNIAGVKEASPDMRKIAAIRAECPDDFAVWSGNDDLVTPILSLGGQGVISVASNLLPQQMQALTRAGLDGDFDTAATIQLSLLPLMSALFCEVNPIPVKAAMKLAGFDCGGCRLPLTDLPEEKREQLKNILARI